MLHTDNANITDAETVDEIIFQSVSAAESFLPMQQNEIDMVVRTVATACHEQALNLARTELAETGCGIVEDKVSEIISASIGLAHRLQDINCIGTLEESAMHGQQTVAAPMGITASFPSPGHPTATVIMQAILCLKSRNPVIFSFHQSAYHSCQAAAKLIIHAAKKAGAPEHAVQWLPQDSMSGISLLLQNPEIACIFMDGTSSVLRTETMPQVPILGHGHINTPCLIHHSADIEQAATDVVMSRYFDNGLIATAEQTVIISREIYFQTLDLMMQKSCHLVSDEEREQLELLLFDQATGISNKECSGKNAHQLAEMAGFQVPHNTKLLLVEVGGIGHSHPLSRPKDFPVIAIMACENWYEGLCFCETMLEFSTSSHTAVLHARDKNIIKEFTERLNVFHLLINRPATRGDISEFIGSTGINMTSASDRQAGNPAMATLNLEMLISRKHIQKPVTRKREWKTPETLIYSPDSILHLQSLKNMTRTLIVTDKDLVDSECMDRVVQLLGECSQPVVTDFFCSPGDTADINSIGQGLECIQRFHPTTLLAVGSRCAMDTSKAMHYFHHNSSDMDSQLKPDFAAFDFPVCSDEQKRPARISLVTVPSSPGSGAEMNGSVTFFNNSMTKSRTIQECSLIPDVCLIDSGLMAGHDNRDIRFSGIHILACALEAYVSPLASDYSDSMAMKSIQLVFQHLVPAAGGKPECLDKIYNAAAMSGIAGSNAKNGLLMAMSNSLTCGFRMSPEKAASLLLPHILRYNGVEEPSCYNPLIVGSRYNAHERYQEVAKLLGLPCKNPEQGVDSLITAVCELQNTLNLPQVITEHDISGPEFTSKIEAMSDQAFGDNATATNPRLPRITEIAAIFTELYRC